MKYIFITGGVVSSLGKAGGGFPRHPARIARPARGLPEVRPLSNVDPGTMNPFQHGEVYVLNDGAETDLDLGHYERFTNCFLSRHNNLTKRPGLRKRDPQGKRRGDYLGKTVQVIPHVTDEIKNRIREVAAESKAGVVITEIGGTTGDIEGLPIPGSDPAIHSRSRPQNVVNVHVTLVPYIRAAGELKDKTDAAKHRETPRDRLQPQVLLCRTEHPLDAELRQKPRCSATFPPRGVIEARDVKHHDFEMPLMLNEEGLDDLICECSRSRRRNRT